jgi:hypothetical protein
MILLLTCCLSTLPAGSVSGFVHIEYNLPSDDFADEDNFISDGYAQSGLGGGAGFILPLSRSPLDVTGEAAFLYQFIDIEEIEDDGILLPLEKAEGGGYLMFPFLTGLRFRHPVDPKIKVCIEAQGGIYLLMQRDMEVTVNGNDIDLSFDNASDFAFSFGVGLQFGNVLFGFRYLRFAEPEYDMEVDGPGFGFTNPDERQFDTAMIQIRAGWEF